MPGFNMNRGLTDSGLDHRVETARSSRWKLALPGVFGDIEIPILGFVRPTFSYDEITMHHGQNQISLPGKYRWGDVDLRFYETFGTGKLRSHVMAGLREWVLGSNNPNYLSVGNFSTHSLNISDRKWLREIVITQNDGSGNPIYYYRLNGVWPIKISPDDLSYDKSQINIVTLTVKCNSVEEGDAIIIN